MKTCVLDASIATKWFYEEAMSKEADALLVNIQEAQLKAVVPEFFYLEMANMFWSQHRKRNTSAIGVNELFDKLRKVELEVHRELELSQLALFYALQLGITVYDSLYLVLAESLNIPFLTADHGIMRASEKAGFKFVQSLEEFCA